MQAQCVGNICTNTNVEPIDPDERTLDCEKQAYMYSIFDKVVKTSFGMQLVTRFAGDNTCATKIWKEEGVRGLTTGVVPRVLYIAPSVVIFFVAY